MYDCINCKLCNVGINLPSDKKDRFYRRPSFSCQECRAQHMFRLNKNQIEVTAVQLRMSGWNMWFNPIYNRTRYVKMGKDVSHAKGREEYNFDGCILPNRFFELKAFL